MDTENTGKRNPFVAEIIYDSPGVADFRRFLSLGPIPGRESPKQG
jgi:hypothetical protein